MAVVGSVATNKVVEILTDPSGLPWAVAAIAEREELGLTLVEAEQVLAQNVGFELAERSAGVKYPVFYVYCEGLANLLKEKFRTFSGKAYMAVEVRISHDRLEGMTEELHLYASAITEVLDGRRGEWEPGMYYTGGYKVEFGGIKRGGKNLLQTAKITFEVEVSL
jgi:hypothetical protein